MIRPNLRGEAPHPSRDDGREATDRLRRLETKITRLCEHFDIDTGARVPNWRDGVIVVHSPMTSIKDLLSVVPEDWDREQEIVVEHKHEEMMSFFAPPIKV